MYAQLIFNAMFAVDTFFLMTLEYILVSFSTRPRFLILNDLIFTSTIIK